MTLSGRTATAVAWMGSGEIARQVIQLVIGVILARLLVPADFGLLAMAMFAVGLAEAVARCGFAEAMIQRDDIDDLDWSSAYWGGLGLGLAAGALAWAMAPLAADFYRDQRVTLIVRTAGWTGLVRAFGITQSAWLARRMEFSTIAKAEWEGLVIGGVVAVWLARTGWGAWSLIATVLVSQGATSLLLHVTCPWRPRFAFRASRLRWVIRFGLGFQGFGIVNYLNRRLDDALIGRYIGPLGLGYYSRAYQLMLYPVQHVSGIVGRVMFPALSTIKDDRPRLRAAYLRAVSMITTIAAPAMLGLFVTASEVVPVIYGQQWTPTVPLLRILCIVGLIQAIASTVGWIYLVYARTDLMLAWGIGSTVFIATCFLVGLRWGVMGVTVSYAIGVLALTYPCLAIPFRLIALPLSDLIRTVQGVLFGATIMAVIVAIVRALAINSQLPAPLVLAISLATGMLTYSTWLWNTDARIFNEARVAWGRLASVRGGRAANGL